MGNLNKTIADKFFQIAQALEAGAITKKPRIAITGMGSEVKDVLSANTNIIQLEVALAGERNAMLGAEMAAKKGIDVVYIGSLKSDNPNITCVEVPNDEAGHKKMDELLDNHEIDGAVTMHYPFPIGVSTVGRVITPERGKEMFIANTTGTSSTDRIEGMVKNAIYGIITAKACGYEDPTVGILNVDGARQTEMALNELKKGGYKFTWADSRRNDGGAVMRGNDILQASPNIMVTDSLTGNLITKMLSSFTTGGGFEATGFGYGPGIGMDYDKLVLIVSRASGAPIIANALIYAGELIRGHLFEVAKKEFKLAEKAGLSGILEEIRAKNAKGSGGGEEVKMPPKEPVPAAILGVEVMDLENAVKELWKAGIYSESGMGCTGPVVMMSDANHDKAVEILRKAGYVQ